MNTIVNSSKRLALIGILLLVWSMISCAPSQGNLSDGRIVFQSNRDGNYDLYVINPDGSDLRKIADFPNTQFDPDDNNGFFSSPDGSKIAYYSDDEGNSEIYVIDIDRGTPPSNLTHNGADDFWGAWSPDGRQIAFVSDRDAVLIDPNRDSWTNNIYVMNANGTNVRRLTVDNTTRQFGSLSWSPNEKILASGISSDSPNRISTSLVYLLSPNDPGLVTLNSSADVVYGIVAWSPNGKHILYSESGSMSNVIKIMDADGTNQVALSNDLLGIAINASWSPDGDCILFSTLQFQIQSGTRKFYIYSVDVDGMDLVALSNDSSAYDTSPSWSPDGKHIVFASKRDEGEYHLYIMNSDGTNLRKLTNGPGEEAAPNWLPAP